jgi:hypothetical protein
MSKLDLLATVGGTLLVTLVASLGAAAPLTQAADATIKAAATLTMVEDAHGTHRVCRLGRVPRWGGIVRLHRHVGGASVPVRC